METKAHMTNNYETDYYRQTQKRQICESLVNSKVNVYDERGLAHTGAVPLQVNKIA